MDETKTSVSVSAKDQAEAKERLSSMKKRLGMQLVACTKGPFSGLLVKEVMDKTPASKCGVLKLDIITHFCSDRTTLIWEKMDATAEFQRVYQDTLPGDRVKFKILRGWETIIKATKIEAEGFKNSDIAEVRRCAGL